MRRPVSTGGSGGRFTKPAGEGSTPSRDATATGTARTSRCAAGPRTPKLPTTHPRVRLHGAPHPGCGSTGAAPWRATPWVRSGGCGRVAGVGSLLLSLGDRALRFRSAVLPFESARGRRRDRATAAHWAHNPARKRTRFDSGPCYGDNARCDAALIRPAAVVRVHVSPLRDRLAVGQLRFERRKRAFESCARNHAGLAVW